MKKPVLTVTHEYEVIAHHEKVDNETGEIREYNLIRDTITINGTYDEIRYYRCYGDDYINNDCWTEWHTTKDALDNWKNMLD